MSSQTFINRCNNMIGNRISGFIQVDISKKSTLTDILYYSVKNIVIERFAKWSTISSKLDYGCILILFHTIPDRKLFAQHVRDLCEYVNTTLGVIIKVTACFYEMDISLLPGVFKICDKRNDGADYLFDHGLLMLNHEGRIESTIIEDCLECLRGNTWAFRDGFSVAEFKGYVDKLETSIFQGWATLSRSAFLLGRYIISKKHLSHTVIDDFSMYLKAEKSVEALFDYLKSEIISPALKELQDGERQEINTVLCFVAEHLDSDLSLSSVAKRVGLHPTYFSYLFKQEMGTNFIDFVNTLRIEKARTLLMNRSLMIKDISEQCGFSDVTYFSRKFKQTVGMSPNAWRLQK